MRWGKNLRNLAWNTSYAHKNTSMGEMLNISDSWMEMSFLSNFNTLVQILPGSIDLLESNESMKFAISIL